MATHTGDLRQDVGPIPVSIDRPRWLFGVLGFDWLLVAVMIWPLVGTYLDARAHNHVVIESFFNPWHAVLYSGVLALACFVVGMAVVNHRRGYAWRHALPPGHLLTLAGVGVIAFTGVADMLWHLAFGIEQQFNAALSPTHLLGTVGFAMVASGPLRAAWRRPTIAFAPTRRGWLAQLAMLLSLTFTLNTLTTITQYAHPFVWPLAATPERTIDPQFGQEIGVLSIVLQSALLMGLVLFVVRRWRLLPGSLTLVLTLNAIVLSVMRDHYLFIVVALLAGIAADLLVWRLRPTAERSTELRLFAFAVPVILYLLYFLAIQLTTGTWWLIHLWMGSVVLAGVAGWLLSYLAVPPPSPADA